MSSQVPVPHPLDVDVEVALHLPEGVLDESGDRDRRDAIISFSIVCEILY